MQRMRLPALLVSFGVLAVTMLILPSHAVGATGAAAVPDRPLRVDDRGRERDGRDREPRPPQAKESGEDKQASKDDSNGAAPPPGAMGDYLPGPGMMGGYYGGMGPGVMGAYQGDMGPVVISSRCGRGLGRVRLSRDQLAKVDKICDKLRKRQWELAGKMMDERARMRDLYNADHRNTEAIIKQYGNIQALQRQMLAQSLEAEGKLEAVLSKNQLAQYRNLRRWAAY